MLAEPTAKAAGFDFLTGYHTKPLCQRGIVGRCEHEIGNDWDQSFPGKRIKHRGLLTILFQKLHMGYSSLLQILNSFHELF